jgi:hypothetical protein
MSCIEFIGCTGTGKSTLVNRILQICHTEGIDAWLGEDFLLSRFHLGWVECFKVRATIVNLTALSVALANWGKYWQFYSFARRTTFSHQISWRQKIYLYRNVLKLIGIYEIAHSEAGSHQIILLDEGPLHSSNALFVHPATVPPTIELSEFMRVVPFPDAVVYLRNQKDTLIQRTLARGHKRIRNSTPHEVEQFIESAMAVFERLAQQHAVQDKLIIVNDHHINSPHSSSTVLNNFIVNIIGASLNEISN